MKNNESQLKLYGVKVLSNRKKLNFTQKQLADKVGVSHEWICKIEKGKVNALSMSLMNKINNVLKMNVSYVIIDDFV